MAPSLAVSSELIKGSLNSPTIYDSIPESLAQDDEGKLGLAPPFTFTASSHDIPSTSKREELAFVECLWLHPLEPCRSGGRSGQVCRTFITVLLLKGLIFMFRRREIGLGRSHGVWGYFINLGTKSSSTGACFTERNDPLKPPWDESNFLGGWAAQKERDTKLRLSRASSQ